MHPDRISVRDFVLQLGYQKGVENILAVCYYGEFVNGRQDISLAEIQEMLLAAKIPQPQNLARDVKALAARHFLNIHGRQGSGIRYSLTNIGAEEVTNRMQAVGLVFAKPTERAEILKEVSDSLHGLLLTIPLVDERDYIEEAVSCLSPVNNAMRAGVVMAWEAVVHNLRRKVDGRGSPGYAEFTRHLQAAMKAKPVATLNDFEDVKDVHMLDVCEKMDIIKGKSVKNQLDHWLAFRNGCGHPSNVKPGINKVKAYFEDIIQYVLAVA